MATHDYVISNGTGSAVRSDLNGALAAIVSQNSNASAPATTYAYMSWADTSAGVMKMRNGANSAWISLYELDGTFLASDISLAAGSAAAPSLFFTGDTNTGLFSPGTDTVALATAGSNRLHISSGGLVGIGTTSPQAALDVSGSALLTNSSYLGFGNADALIQGSSASGANFLMFRTNVSERARIDHAGRFLVGTSSARSNLFNASYSPFVQIETSGSLTERTLNLAYNNGGGSPGGAILNFTTSRGSTAGSNTIVANNDELGGINFCGADGTRPITGAFIGAYVDGTPGNLDMPGRLVFSTTADGASSPTERLRITNAGNVTIGTDGTTTLYNQTSITGAVIERPGAIQLARSNDTLLLINRISTDGDLVSFYQNGTAEGSISVSGSTVSYNGAHLSRWSQLPGGTERIEILRGTVLSNIDEMCGWGEETNEQLNRMKVSDVEGDKNVSGVFQCWDDDDDTYTDDFYCAMTGDFIIRIAEGVTVERGDLLMSAGDGTAKPQDDDIIRSKTVAKVTSTHVTCTYEDGSYCVPCVLMAC